MASIRVSQVRQLPYVRSTYDNKPEIGKDMQDTEVDSLRRLLVSAPSPLSVAAALQTYTLRCHRKIGSCVVPIHGMCLGRLGDKVKEMTNGTDLRDRKCLDGEEAAYYKDGEGVEVIRQESVCFPSASHEAPHVGRKLSD